VLTDGIGDEVDELDGGQLQVEFVNDNDEEELLEELGLLGTRLVLTSSFERTAAAADGVTQVSGGFDDGDLTPVAYLELTTMEKRNDQRKIDVEPIIKFINV
jgi:hypothetical protein